MVVIVRIDLDRYSIDQLSQLIQQGVVSYQEASESKAYTELSEVQRLLIFRHWKSIAHRKIAV